MLFNFIAAVSNEHTCQLNEKINKNMKITLPWENFMRLKKTA